MDPKPSHVDNYLKIAILPYKELKKNGANGNNKDVPEWILSSYDPTKSLDYLIQSSAPSFHLPPPYSSYALLLTEKSGAPFPYYITEDNRKEIINGSVLQIYYSPKEFVSRLLHRTQTVTEPDERMQLMAEILEHVSDSVFVYEFDRQQGTQWLVQTIQNKELARELHCSVLEIFNKIMEHEIIRWSVIEKQFIDSVMANIYRIEAENDIDKRILINSLIVLESALQFAAGKFLTEIEKQFSLPNLIKLLKNDQLPAVQQSVLAFINCYLSKIDSSRKQAVISTLNNRLFRETVLQHVILRKNSNNLNGNSNSNAMSNSNSNNIDNDNSKSIDIGHRSEMQHQLYVLQTLLLKSYDDKLFSGASFEEARDKVMEIRSNFVLTMERDTGDSNRNAFKSTTSIASASSAGSNLSDKNYSEDFEKLGFPNVTHPWETFSEPPGALVLELLHYFSKVHPDAFLSFVYENSSSGERSHDCPLVIASIRLTKLLCDLLGVGQQPRDDGKEFYPMIIESDKPLEEFFSIGLSLFNRTWHEIHATSSDIDIVCDFLKEKLCKTLQNPCHTNKFEGFKKELSKITYNDIKNRWNEERKKRDIQKEELPVIKDLRGLLKPEMAELVKFNRLNYLVKGTRFDKYTNKGQRIKDKFWQCRLSPNYKTLLYGDCDDDVRTSGAGDEKLLNKLNITDIGELLVGKACPHMRESKGKKSTVALAFALVPKDDSVQSLCFCAPDEDTFHYWMDGLNALLGKPMNSKEAEESSNMLLELDIKLRLLDIEGLSIPDRMPEIPPLPTSFDFAIKSNFASG